MNISTATAPQTPPTSESAPLAIDVRDVEYSYGERKALDALSLEVPAGAIFGLGYGAYQSVDWALVADVLPSEKHFARDMGIWNISLSLPQVIAPVIGGPIIDHFTHAGNPLAGYQVIFAMSIIYCLIGTVTVRFIKGVKR